MNAEFYASLPRRYVGSGLLITDDAGHILMVEPTYKQHWEIPGGVVEEGETPPEAARRECQEELGLSVEPGRLLTVDHQHRAGMGDSSMYVYEGALTPDQVSRIVLPADELKGWRFLPVERLEDYTTPRIAGRLRAALQARATGTLEELENGEPRLPGLAH